MTELLSDIRIVKYEEELAHDLARQVASQPGGEHIWDCLQCGTCSAICPVSPYMDLTPRQIVGLVRAGFRDDVLGSQAIWVCTSCYACTSECPAGIRITDIMYILRRMAMQDGRYRRSIIPTVERTFIKMVSKTGRLSESRMGLAVARKSGVRALIGMVPLAWKLIRKGRMRLRGKESVRDVAGFRRFLAAIEAARRRPSKPVPGAVR